METNSQGDSKKENVNNIEEVLIVRTVISEENFQSKDKAIKNVDFLKVFVLHDKRVMKIV